MRAKGANSDDPHAAWVDASRRFVLKDPNFVGDPAVDPSKLVFKMMLLGRSIDDLENNERLDPQLVAGFVKTQMGQEYSSLVKVSSRTFSKRCDVHCFPYPLHSFTSTTSVLKKV